MRPVVIYEADIAAEVSAGSKISLVGCGDEEAVGWFLLAERPNGVTSILIKERGVEARLIKTLPGVYELLKRTPGIDELRLPFRASFRNEDELWRWQAKHNENALHKDDAK